MWFPVGGIKTDGDLVPKQRESIMPADVIVQEYLRMSALMSYVGDLIVPYKSTTLSIDKNKEVEVGTEFYRSKSDKLHRAKGRRASKDQNSVDDGVAKRVQGVVSTDLYVTAMKEAVSVWTPLLGTLQIHYLYYDYAIVTSHVVDNCI